MKPSIVNWFKTISITKKLYFVIGIMTLLIAVELIALLFSITTLTSIRALIAIAAELFGLFLIISLSIGIPKGIKEITRVATKISEADFSDKAKIYSQDEMGQLAVSFNKMIENFQQVINEREQEVQAICNNAPDAVIVIDRESIIIKWNRIAEKIFGWNKEEVIGKPLYDFIIPPKYRDAHIKGMKRFLETGVGPVLNQTIDIEALNKQKKIFSISLSISPTVIDGKQLFIGFIRDVTKRKEMEEVIQQQRHLYKSLIKAQSEMGEGITIIENKKIIYANDALYKICGYSKEEISNIPSFIDIIVAEDREKFSKQLNNCLSGHEMVDIEETAIIRKDGAIKYIEYSVKMIKMEERVQLLCVIRDITFRKKAEKELKQKTEELIRSNAELEQFAYIASHDLQEPLRMINSYVQLLSERYKDKLDNDANDFIAFAIDGSNRMRNLIQSLLEYSRVNRVRPFDWIDTNEILQNVLNDLQDSIKENKATVKIDKLPDMVGDTVLIGQLFQNLISNAIKFRNSNDPEIIISGKKVNNEYLFSVKDNGIGIKKEYSDKIFIIFQRLHTKEKYPGTGIGLAICKKIVERHGGKIWVESEEGKGSTFYFTIKQIPETSINNKEKLPQSIIAKTNVQSPSSALLETASDKQAKLHSYMEENKN